MLLDYRHKHGDQKVFHLAEVLVYISVAALVRLHGVNVAPLRDILDVRLKRLRPNLVSSVDSYSVTIRKRAQVDLGNIVLAARLTHSYAIISPSPRRALRRSLR